MRFLSKFCSLRSRKGINFSNQRLLSGGESFKLFHADPSLTESSSRISPKSESQCVIVFGSAGMTPKQLSKFSQLYNSLGYKTISCILPQQHIFHYDIPQIKACSQKVLDEVKQHNFDTVLTHSLSNTGVSVYQQFSQLVISQQPKNIKINGAVFDSGPGIIGPLQLLFPSWKFDPPALPSRLWFYFGLLFANIANKVGVKDTLTQLMTQRKLLDPYSTTPWVGYYIRHEDQGDWPMLFIYSDNDILQPASFVTSLIKEIRSRGEERCIETAKFDKSGHIAHFKMYPKKYFDTVKQFIKKTQ